jgi:hypothetical protein
MYRAALLLLMVVLPSGTTLSKCANRLIHLEGRVDGISRNGLRILVQVTPDPNWEPQSEIAIKDGSFVGTVLFNATKSEGRVRDDCSRVPKKVYVVLLKNDHEVNRVQLDISQDFVKDKLGDYKLRSPIMLHAP